MKFELPPDNRDQADEVLLDDLRRVAKLLGKQSVLQREYDPPSANTPRLGRFSRSTFYTRFGSWKRALELAGLVPSKVWDISRDEATADLKRVAKLCHPEPISIKRYEQFGRYGLKTVKRLFGSWRDALEALDIPISPSFRPTVSVDDLLENLAHVWESLGHPPTTADLNSPTSRYGADPYRKRFGSLRKALERLALEAQGSTVGSNLTSTPKETVPTCEGSVGQHEREEQEPRKPGWKLRFQVMERDHFKCRACGRSPSMDAGIVLHIDHIMPWSRGGRTTQDNLQTLCEQCNLGKGSQPPAIDREPT